MRRLFLLMGLMISHGAAAQSVSALLYNTLPTFPGCVPPGTPTSTSVVPVAIGDGLRGVSTQQLLQPAFAQGDLRLFGWADTTADQTAVFQRALDAQPSSGGEIVIPFGSNGTTLGGITINKPVTIRGAGGPLGQATIRPSSRTTTIFTVAAPFVTFDDLAFSPADVFGAKQTAGSFIRVVNRGAAARGDRFRAARISMTEFNEGITVENVATVEISQFRGLLYSNGVSTTAACLHFLGGLDVRVDGVLCNGPASTTAIPNARAGVWIEGLSDGVFSHMDIIAMGTDLLVAPGDGQSVTSLWVVDSFLDTATRGADFAPTGGGVIARSRLTNVWASSHAAQGIRVGAGTDGLDITTPHALLNASHGIALMGGTNIAIQGGQVAQNQDNGIYVAPGVSDWSVIGAALGKTAGLDGNTNFGVYVDAGASDRYRIVDNLIQGNVRGAIVDNGSGVHKAVWNNIGPGDGYRAYRDTGTGYLVIVGRQGGAYGGYSFQTDDGTERFRISSTGVSAAGVSAASTSTDALMVGGKTVTFGPPESGGPGHRMLIVPND